MPFDGTDYQPEMSLEEKALRNVDDFFTGPEQWWQGAHTGPNGSKCVGGALIAAYRQIANLDIHFGDGVAEDILAISCTPVWNDAPTTCFADVKTHLKSRIEYYTKQRLSHSYIVIIGPGRQVRV